MESEYIMVNHGVISTYLITLIGIVYTIVIGLSATGLVQIGVPAQYAGAIVLLISVLYNIAFPRNPAPIQSS